MKKTVHLLLVLMSFLLLTVTVQAADVNGLGHLPDGYFFSKAYAVSADGSVVIGISDSSGSLEAFRWTSSTGMIGLGDLLGGSSDSGAYGVSADGSVVVGLSHSTNGTQAFRWTSSTGMVGLGALEGGGYSRAYGASADGSVVVGQSSSANGIEAFRWTSSTGMIGLDSLSGGRFYSRAFDVSANGSVVVGQSSSANGYEAFRWTSAGMVGLGDLAGGGYDSGASAVSADGSVVVGTSHSINGDEAFRWTSSTGMVGLGALEGGETFDSRATGVSAYGNIVVGDSSSSNGYEAFRWTTRSGMESIKELLIAEGINMDGWSLDQATAVSADGSIIVGQGRSTNGTEAYLVRIDSGLLTTSNVAQSIATLLPVTESVHGLASESLSTHLNVGRHYRGHADSTLNLYAAGFGGEWNSYTVGGTLGLAWDYSDNIRIGAGIFKSSYNENDLDFSGKYQLDSLGGTLWVGYEASGGGLQLHIVGLLANLDSDIKRGYLNGFGLDSSQGTADGNMSGVLLRGGWKLPVTDKYSVTPFISYSWTKVEMGDYTETGGGFPAYFDSRKDSGRIVKAGLEGEAQLSATIGLWVNAAYGRRHDDRSAGISGKIIGLMDFSQPGYQLDRDWFEADLGLKWQATQDLSVIFSLGGTAGSEQTPDWRTSLGVSWAFM